ncbi:MAG: diaminopimelate epimerase [Elusimicrobiales bacterium]|nr:diaminopimelate epimerase [Elusimicrobiales bacterium]
MKFWKMSGAGNDFVLIEDKSFSYKYLSGLAVKLCRRRISIGADGLLAVSRLDNGNVRMRYFNSDGTEAFCGNGSRCSLLWAYAKGLCGRKVSLEALPGILNAEIISDKEVKMAMPDVKSPEMLNLNLLSGIKKDIIFMDTGVPHCVVILPEWQLDSFDIASEGRALRYNKIFPQGANVDFISISKPDDSVALVKVRTYERGVEAETLACGTGITASAIAAALSAKLPSPVSLRSLSGENFKVWFEISNGPEYEARLEKDSRKNSLFPDAKNIFIQGPAEITFTGEINV